MAVYEGKFKSLMVDGRYIRFDWADPIRAIEERHSNLVRGIEIRDYHPSKYNFVQWMERRRGLKRLTVRLVPETREIEFQVSSWQYYVVFQWPPRELQKGWRSRLAFTICRCRYLIRRAKRSPTPGSTLFVKEYEV